MKSPLGWVHNLEHGYVVFLYRCPGAAAGAEGCPSADEMSQLQALFDQAPAPTIGQCPSKVVIGRFDDMSTRFAMLAWGRSFLTDDFQLDTALQFAQQWMEHAAVPENQAC